MVHLKPFLDEILQTYQRTEFLGSDPIGLVHACPDDPREREVAAVLAAVLAYGNVKQIRRSVEGLFFRMRESYGSLAAFVDAWPQVKENRVLRERQRRRFSDWVHRFTRAEHMDRFFDALSSSWQQWGSVGQELSEQLATWKDADAPLEHALDGMLLRWESVAGPDYLITRPARGSACKRWLMLCRWMGRRDAIDLGLWMPESPLLKGESIGLLPRQLLMPLDTHTGRLSRMLGLTNRKQMGWLAVREVSAALRELSPQDPIRYDFALARLGILDLCQGRYRWQICNQCTIQPVCSVGSSTQRSFTV